MKSDFIAQSLIILLWW